MSANSGNGGVRNLRAMFENKAGDQSTSPPSRGRSPNPSELSNNSRPVSKVRASFVAVERPGENGSGPILGLRRASEVSSLGGIHENMVTEGSDLDKKPITRVGSGLGSDATQVTKKAPSNNGTNGDGLGKILKGSAFESNTPSKPPRISPQVEKQDGVFSSPRALQKVPKSPAKDKDTSKAAEMVKKMKPVEGTKPGPAPTTRLQTTRSAQPVKSLPTRIATKPDPKSPTLSKPSPKTPTSAGVANIKGGPAKIKGVMDSAKQAQQSRAEKQASDKATEKVKTAPKIETKVASKSTETPRAGQKAPSSPHSTRSAISSGPKSPLRPVRLPSAATATTASAAAKDSHHPSRPETETRKSVARRASTLSVRPPRVSTSSVATLNKKSSRVSLANGHEKHERPVSRVSTSTARADEGFLARMMRPTTSSAQKTHDKIQVNSPPRLRTSTSHRPREGSATKKPPPKIQQLKSQPPPAVPKQDHSQHADPVEVADEQVPEPTQPEITQEASESATVPPLGADVPVPAVDKEEETQPEADVPQMIVDKEQDVQPEKSSQKPAPINGNVVLVEQEG
ncbi:hypothetical protein B0A52_07953 [Exophiala mesophila]|uniref:Uncharacterized protein n=1 Tax=Exophiala mesophila TaxID=212818 RepID=A0A438MZG0_EXOME|nr:hypothetical protein B0A52_07953 [Exophiala mesophila]